MRKLLLNWQFDRRLFVRDRLLADFEDKLADVTGAKHRSVGIFGRKDCEFALMDRVESLRYIVEELDILLVVELGTWRAYCATRAPSKLLLTAKDNLDVDILVMNFEGCGRARTQLQLRDVYKDIVAVDFVTANSESRNIGAIEPLESCAQA